MGIRAAAAALATVVAAGVGIAAATVLLPSSPADATHPCPTSSYSSPTASASPTATATESPGTTTASPSPSGTATPPPEYSHPACPGDPPAPLAAEHTVTNSADGSTVRMHVGERLRVSLTSDTSQIWSDIDSWGVLYRTRLYVTGGQTDAVFWAMTSTEGQQVTATTDEACRHADPACAPAPRTWSITVVVDPAFGPATAQPEPCYAHPVPEPPPGTAVLTEGDDGRTVQVRQGQAVLVYFGGDCPAGGGYRPPIGGGPLFREHATSFQPGSADGTFRAVGTGTTEISATTDAPCLHENPGCAFAQRAWTARVEVLPADCRITGPQSVSAGSTVRLGGYAAPGATVQVWFRRRGATEFVVRRVVTAGSDGSFLASYLGVDDHRWYATSGGCTTAQGITWVLPTTSGPPTAARGTRVPVVVRGPAGAAVQVWFRRAGESFAVRRTGTLDSQGYYRTSYVATSDQRYYARTGPDGRISAGVLTQVR